ncbi:MAG TPA: OmpA family protein [Nitrospira sp.]|nr:OmpA family protein [Nitrospira sp.]
MNHSLKTFIAMLMTVGLVQGCASWSGSGSGEEFAGRTEQISEADIKYIPPPDVGMTVSRPRPSMRAEVAARNATGMPAGSLRDVLFDFDQAVLRPDAFALLDANAKRLQADGVTRLLLEGRGDEFGTAAYNMVLGDHRAKQVKRYLEELGLIVEFKTTSYGKDRPLCFEHSLDCYQRNRSVHFVVKE